MRIEDVFDLNELNVKKFLKHCKARPGEKDDELNTVYAYIDENGRYDPRTIVKFSIDRYEKQRDRIASMLGQLKKIHDRDKSPVKENYLLDFLDLQTKYDGTRWTEDPNCTIFLYWLGNAGSYFSGLKKDKDGIYRTNLKDAIMIIEACESPSDPVLVKRFPKKREPADD